MSWFFLALLGPLLYAITNHIDKILLEKHVKEGGPGALFLISSLLSIIAIPFLWLFDPSVLNVDIKNITILAIVGIFNSALILCYLYAMDEDEASIIVVFYQLVPVLGYILGYIFLDEQLTKLQIIAMAIIILGTTIISFEIDQENKFKLRKKTIFFMSLASIFWASGAVIFKAVALEENVIRSLFWEHVVLSIIGILTFIFVKSYRKNFLYSIKKNSKKIISLNITNEVLYISGNIIMSFAYLLAPVSLVLLTDSFQPIFVFAIGIFMTKFFPKITAEKITAKHLWQKMIAIFITGIGTYLLFM